jgi:hypothetical protein
VDKYDDLLDAIFKIFPKTLGCFICVLGWSGP